MLQSALPILIGLWFGWPAAFPNPALAQNPCGLSSRDWCPSPAGDPCGRHQNERECRADRACVGMRYRGESVVACQPDGRGFWTNCPAVGCISRPSPTAPAR